MSPATIVRVRWLRCGAGGLVDGRCAAAAARRERADRLLHAVDFWRNLAPIHRHQCCLPAGIGACSHDELADHGAQDAAVFAGRVDFQAQRQCCSACTTSIGLAAAMLETAAAFGKGLRVRHVEKELLKILNLLCGASAAASDQPRQSRRRTSGATAAVLLAEWRARALAMAAAAAGAAGGAAGCVLLLLLLVVAVQQ